MKRRVRLSNIRGKETLFPLRSEQGLFGAGREENNEIHNDYAVTRFGSSDNNGDQA